MTRSTHLQTKLDNITTQTRALVQPERLAVTEMAVHDLLLTGIEDRVLPVGAMAPSFQLPDAAACALGNVSSSRTRFVSSSDLLAIGPLIVLFFRGRWCPYCITQLEAWQAAFPQVREHGALLVAISPQLPRQNDFAAQHHGLTYPLLSDAGCRIADEFRVAYTIPEPLQQHYRSMMINLPFIHGDQGPQTWRLPIPATFVIAPSGKILFAEAHAEHRVRPDPYDVLAVLDGHQRS
ncbi:MAG: peroxiredoxin-like family protein [Acidobacteriaceae bacterium]